jgi:DNA-binding CsgD family transcriptional regulator
MINEAEDQLAPPFYKKRKGNTKNYSEPISDNGKHIWERREGKTPEFLFSCCLIDHSGRQYACIHECCNADSVCIKHPHSQPNVDFQTLYFHPDDKTLLCEKIFPDILAVVSKLPETELENYRFTFNHRYLRKDESTSQFLLEGTFVVSREGIPPFLNVKVFSEIGEIKTDENMILTIFKYTPDQGYQKIFTKNYRKECKAVLSQRELEIIKLCLDGLSSKMIADKLNLSIHTVKNHKRNSMDKTLTHNITELIHLCILNHWV